MALLERLGSTLPYLIENGVLSPVLSSEEPHETEPFLSVGPHFLLTFYLHPPSRDLGQDLQPVSHVLVHSSCLYRPLFVLLTWRFLRTPRGRRFVFH